MKRNKTLKQIITKTIAILSLCCWFIMAQPGTLLAEEIFPALTGAELEEAIAREYRPETSLGYDRARDFMYTQTDNQDGIVTAIYTGYQGNIAPDSETPRRDASAQKINAEHVYPRGKGAKQGQAKSDLHSLFPSLAAVNSERDNHPFAEISDSLTQKWFRDDQELTTLPIRFNINEYSESITDKLFEPREDKKGDVARAMFYFYTVYRFQADDADASFFPRQQTALCQWNAKDPADRKEKERSHKIAEFQGNENPFVIDDTLAERTYCPEQQQ
ncbi:MAG: endonuclease [Cyanobacteria bacterium J06621_8]